MRRFSDIKRKAADIAAYAILACFVLAVVLPLGWIISTSFKPSAEIFATPPHWIPRDITIQNYKSVLTESSIPAAFVNSFLIALLTMMIALLFGGMAGYSLARFNFRGNRTLSLFMLMSQMLPVTVLMIPIYYMAGGLNLLDHKTTVSITHLIITLPMVTWMMRGYFKSIPWEIEEAAMIDGCTALRLFAHVLLPLLRPALAATGVYAFICSWNEFVLANILTRTMNSKTLPLSLNEFSSYFKVNWGETMAAAVIITIPVIVFFIMVQKHFVEGLASGAVKG